jgi:hypothetical protein
MLKYILYFFKHKCKAFMASKYGLKRKLNCYHFYFCLHVGLKTYAKYLYNCRKLSNMELKRKTVSALHQG